MAKRFVYWTSDAAHGSSPPAKAFVASRAIWARASSTVRYCYWRLPPKRKKALSAVHNERCVTFESQPMAL